MPRKGQKMPRWTDKEVAYLTRHYPTKTTEWVAEKLGRPLRGVVSKAFHLGLRKTPEYRTRVNRANRLCRP